MAAVSDRAIPAEDTFNMLRDKAKESDDFTVKVMRRQHIGGVPEIAATLSGATVQHFISPELWLPQLAGGGNYSLQGYHSSDLGKPVGGFLQYKVSQDTKEVDASVMKRPEWRGPAVLDFPQKEAPREREQLPLYETRSPSAPGSADSATRSPQSWARQAGGGSVREVEYGGGSSWQEHQRQQGALEAERRKIEETRLEDAKQRHRDELEAIKKSHEADMRALKLELMGQIQQQRPVDNSLADFMKAQAAERLERDKREADDRRERDKIAAEDRREREKIAAEDRRAAELRQEKNEDRFNRLLEKMSDRPKEDPLAMVTKVAELLGKNGGGSEKMMHTMMETMGTINGVAMDFVHAAADLQLGGQKEESPVVKGIEAAVKGLGAMVRGGAMQKRPAPPQYPQPQLPQTYEQQARAPQPGQQPQPPPQQPLQPLPSILEQIMFGIRGKQPVALVAAAIIDNYSEASIQAAVLESGGDMEAIIQSRLGNWVAESPDNKAYLDALKAEIEKRMEAAGLFAEEGEQGNDDPEENPE